MMKVAPLFFGQGTFFFLTYACPLPQITIKSLQIEEPVSFFVEMRPEFLNHGKVEFISLS